MSLIELHNDPDEAPQTIMPIMYVPPRMVTRTRLVPLLAMISRVEMQLAADEETDEVLVCIAIENDVPQK
jgi:hypothetical protein